MSPMRLIILLVAAAAAAGAAFLVRNMSQTPPASPPAAETAAPAEPAPVQVTEVIEVPQTPVLVVTRDLPVGELLTPGDFSWKEWPDKSLNVNYFTQDVTPDAIEQLAGSVVRTAMVENEPVLPHKIVQKGETGYMAALLTPGMRAVSVEISTVNASGGFILPGDRVDVLITYDVELQDGERTVSRPTTTVLMENVRVLAIDQVFSSGETGQFAIGSTATVELAPREARLLVMAKRLGNVSLALRSLQDAEEGGPTMARTDFLLDVAPYSEGAGRNGTGEQVTVYRNGALSVETPQGS